MSHTKLRFSESFVIRKCDHFFGGLDLRNNLIPFAYLHCCEFVYSVYWPFFASVLTSEGGQCVLAVLCSHEATAL